MGRADYYEAGDWNAWCSMCGQKFKASQLKKHWQGMYRCEKCWEPRHPQEFVRAIQENPGVPWVQHSADFFIPMPQNLPGGTVGGTGSGSNNPPPGGGGGSGGSGGDGTLGNGCTILGSTALCDYAVADCAIADNFIDFGGGVTAGCTINGTSGVCDYAVADCSINEFVPSGLGG